MTDWRYTAFHGTGVFKEFDNWTEAVSCVAGGLIPDDAYILSHRTHKWFDCNMKIVEESHEDLL